MAALGSIFDTTKQVAQEDAQSSLVKRVYVFRQAFTAINRDRNSNESKTFQSGAEVLGIPYVPIAAVANVSSVPSALIQDNYIVPLNYLQEKEKIVDLSTSSKDFFDTAQNVQKSSGFKKGALWGTVIGGGYGFIANKNVFMSALLGMTIGGCLGYIIGKKKAAVVLPASSAAPIAPPPANQESEQSSFTPSPQLTIADFNRQITKTNIGTIKKAAEQALGKMLTVVRGQGGAPYLIEDAGSSFNGRRKSGYPDLS